MKTISPRDSSLLALLAESVTTSEDIIKKIKGKEAKRIAFEMLWGDQEYIEAFSTAEGIKRWCRENKK